ncbi:MAG: FMN-binding protein [Phycisphaerae bacterium]|jgi:hypothetical protein|nr:FMN-binding protein [Phycisphaerae bacterium]
MKKFERIAGVVALATVITAWLIGGLRQRVDMDPFLLEAIPTASEFKPVADGIYTARDPRNTSNPVVGYVTVGRAGGYGGPVRVAVGLDTSGNIAGVSIIDHKETPAFFDKIKADDYLKALVGKSYADPLAPGDDIDAVSGATVSLDALTTSIRLGARRLAAEALGLPVQRPLTARIRFALPEILLVLLFATGFLTYSRPLARKPKTRESVRWVTRLAGLLLIGFVFTIPLSIININSLLAGYWPHWRSGIYWYMLIVGAFLPVALTGKNVYCDCLCPFGAAQDVLKVAGPGKYTMPKRYGATLRWTQRFLAWAVILAALLFRNPGHFTYEVFGTFFTLTGAVLQFALLGVVLIASLFLLRPWCNFLCPIRATSDYIRMLRLWGKETFKKPRA